MIAKFDNIEPLRYEGIKGVEASEKGNCDFSELLPGADQKNFVLASFMSNTIQYKTKYNTIQYNFIKVTDTQL